MPEDTIRLTYDPFALPTTQHRAGLAGFLVLIESMRRRDLKPIPETSITEDGSAIIEISPASLQVVLNDLYDAKLVEVTVKAKRRGQEPKRTETKIEEGSGRSQKLYVYDQLVPKAAFLESLGMPEPWLRLWRDAVWSTLRGIPRTRIPYQERCNGRDTPGAAKAISALRRSHKDRQQGEHRTEPIASCLYIGAQAGNPERVPFQGRPEENLLLHFWPVVSQVYVPQSVARDGKRSFQGYVFAIPDVVDIEWFVEGFPQAVSLLGTDMAAYRPLEAVIAVPQEGALEYLRNLLRLAEAKAEAKSCPIACVEVRHLKKTGNSIQILVADRVATDPHVLEEYEAIRLRYRNPLFRRQIVLNVLRSRRWYDGFEKLLSSHGSAFFLGATGAQFQYDAKRRFVTDLEERRSADG